MPRNFISIVLFSIAIVAVIWFVDSPPPQFQTTPEPDPEEFVTVQYFNEINTLQFTTEGLREHSFQSTRVEHQVPAGELETEQASNMTKGKTVIQAPDITFFQNDEIRWQVEALQGESNLGDEKVLLEDQVFLQQRGSDDAWTMRTDSLWIDPNQQYAHTDAPVELKSLGITSTGTGMKADLNQKTIEVLADTHTHYDPSH